MIRKNGDGDEWISIGDFMAGIVGVLVLFFVIAVLITSVSKAEAEEKKNQGLQGMMQALSNLVSENNLKGVEVLEAQGVLRLKDVSFAKGSACLDSRINAVLQKEISPFIAASLAKDGLLSIQIEGHTDAQPISAGFASDGRSTCAPFDDNYTLSAGRAREARKALLNDIEDQQIQKRISVVGYGADRLLNSQQPNSNENRRVEVRFLHFS